MLHGVLTNLKTTFFQICIQIGGTFWRIKVWCSGFEVRMVIQTLKLSHHRHWKWKKYNGKLRVQVETGSSSKLGRWRCFSYRQHSIPQTRTYRPCAVSCYVVWSGLVVTKWTMVHHIVPCFYYSILNIQRDGVLAILVYTTVFFH